MVGWTNTAADVQIAYRWRDGSFELLGALEPDYPSSLAKAINARGMIVGVSVPDPYVSDFAGRATMWQPGAAPFDLGTLEGGTYSSAFAVNDLGVIAGWSDMWNESEGVLEYHAVLWIP